jgi:AcrR family transcriptional regulator
VATKRGDATREHLLDVAEQLFGERGVANVSLREIQIAAEVRNTAAIHFHFGDRDGLLDALAHRHIARIGARQQELWDKVVADDATSDTRRLVEILVRPCAEYITLGPSERAWVKIMAELAAAPDVRLNEMAELAPSRGVEAGQLLHSQMMHVVNDKIARERIYLCARLAVGGSADRARLTDDAAVGMKALPEEVFVENLIDMICGALFAPATPPAPPS